jgi:hypothetical protein
VDLKTLDSTRFQSLCNALVKAVYPEATCLQGSGGDEGIDCFLGSNMDTDNLHVFQHKFLTATLASSGKRQIKESLKQVHSKHPNVSRWTLVIAKDFTAGEIKWFNQLRTAYRTIELDFWDSTKLKYLLRKHNTVSYGFFPIPEHIDKKIIKHLDDLKTNIVQPLLIHLQNLSLENLIPITKGGLYKDLITNHYPGLETNLQNLIGHLRVIESQSSKFGSLIESLLKNHLIEEQINYRIEENDTYDMTNSIPINKFTERLWPLIESGTYSDSRFYLDKGYPDMIRIGFSDLGQGIMYQCLPNENCEEIMRKLQNICRMIIDDINEKLLQYDKIKKARNTLIQDLRQELDEIQYTHNLHFESIDGFRCKYID